jgi:hypothetical protein
VILIDWLVDLPVIPSGTKAWTAGYIIFEYLVQTNCMDCCEGLDHTGERQAGLQELWDIIAKTNPAGVQTLQRRIMLQLGALE